MAFVKNSWPYPWRKCDCCAVTHLEERVQRSILHELCYDHHWLTCGGIKKKANISRAELRGRKKRAQRDEDRGVVHRGVHRCDQLSSLTLWGISWHVVISHGDSF